MTEAKLTRRDLGEVIAEVDRIAQARADQLTEEEARAILRELDLPGELLEEAVRAVRKRTAEARERRKRIALGAAVLLVLAGGLAFVYVHHRHVAAARAVVTAQGAHVAAGSSDAAAATAFHRAGNPEIFFAVTLKDAPAGDALPLTCDWVAPDGAIARQNRWETKAIDRALWPTHCKHRIDASSPTGTWTVRMRQDGREIASAQFAVD
jgi:hypothetical protein